MLYDFTQEAPSSIMAHVAESFKRRRLEKGYSRQFLAAASGVPAPTIARFEQKHAISFESLVKLAQTMGYGEILKNIFDKQFYSTIEELDTINRNKNRKRGDKK